MKIHLTLDVRMYNKKTMKTLMRLTSLRVYKIKLMKKIFAKKVTGGLFDDCYIIPNEKRTIKKIYFEVIFIT